jgi:hypothetical protein
MDDLVKRARRATLYEGHGELSDLPEQLADRIEALEKRVAELEKVALPLAAIADAFEADALDEARPSWGDKPDGVEIYSGRGGKRLLTLDDAFAARAALKGQNNG